MSAAVMTPSPSTCPLSSKPVFEVSTVEARSCRALMSWKKEHCAALADREVADRVDHQQGGMGQHA